ncbi:MAG: 4Fe-4S dicluster domain-containing protein, partial [Bdellovibrionales bacterium]|nr:4Fe-4S dicluster domain-containing protein [Bdellovibrionales bacterium]
MVAERSGEQLVQIGSSSKAEGGVSRRSFLKILGAAPVVAAAGCSDSTKHKAYPNVFGQDDSIPGVAVWYNSTCQECAAGCGVSVRTREGRVVKVEGNKNHPLSKGGLCALGQASLQALYDPDRIRQPLVKTQDDAGNETFAPISWSEAYKRLGVALKFAGADFALLTGEQSGSARTLSADFAEQLGGTRLVYDPLSPVETAEASQLVFGEYGVPTYHLDKADLVVNFGADFLETWSSPVEYARRWADGRRGKSHTRYLHIEPRLSLTAANADRWYTNTPGSELSLAKFLLKHLVENGRGENLSDRVRAGIASLVGKASSAKAAADSHIDERDVLVIAHKLVESRHGVVISGGSAGRSEKGRELAVVVSLINLVLASVGEIVDLSKMRRPESDRQGLVEAAEKLKSGKLKLLLVANGTNPAFTLPADYGFAYALRQGRVEHAKALGEAKLSDNTPFVVSFSSSMDETTKLADLVLPSHHSLEDWGDVEPVSGVRSIVQPAMTPVFDTKSFGDMLLKGAESVGKELPSANGAKSYQDFVKAQWRQVHSQVGSNQDFTSWWMSALERGGIFSDSSDTPRVRISVDESVYGLDLSSPLAAPKNGELTLFPYFSVKSFDGRAANRPWLQELPDPIVQAVWDAWGEINTKSAKKLGIKHGDTITVRNTYGELNVPVYLSDRIAEGVVAVPVGQGHSEFGRYARQVSHVGNVFELLPKSESARRELPLLTTSVSITRAFKKTDLVVVQGSDSQKGRGLARTLVVDKSAHQNGHANGHDSAEGGEHGSHGGGHHEPKQMYKQRVHPLYDWVMGVDLAACTGCSACVTACFAENNIPTVGKKVVFQGREMSWLRIDRYFDEQPETGGHGSHDDDHHPSAEEFTVSFMPMMCQQCNNAPCEPVCPVYATYHNEEGLNVMVYNRCVGTRYCSNNCSYKVRRFNWFEFEFPEPMNLQLNPDVTKRSAGVMEKCTFCVQRIREGQDRAKDAGRTVRDGEIQPACVQSCPTQALAFGNINDPNSTVSKWSK